MSRLPSLPDRSTIAPEELETYDGVVARQARLWEGAPLDSNAYFNAVLTSPPLAAAIVELGRVFRTGSLRGTYSDADRELVDMVLGVELGYNTIAKLHIPDAIAVGVRVEAIQAIYDGDLDALEPAERQIVDFTREAAGGRVTDASYAALVERLGERGALEFAVFVPFLVFTFRAWQAVGVPDVPTEEIHAMLEAYCQGTGAVVAADARHG